MRIKNNIDEAPSFRQDKNLRIIFLITLMAVLGVASVSPAFPKIANELGISPQSIGLLIISFTLPGIFLTPVLGVLADRIGRKTVLVPSLFLFAIAGGTCAAVRDFEVLLLLRFFQGIGAAALGALNITIIGDLYDGKKRAIAMGYNASVLSIATATYPFLGGLLATFAWYYPFYLAILAIPIGLIVLFRLDSPRSQQKQKLRSYLKNAFLCLLDRRAGLYFIAGMVTFIILYGSYLTYIPIFLHERFAAESVEIGLVMACMSLTTAITSSQIRRLTKRWNESQLLRLSFLFYAAALLLIPFVFSLWLILLPIILYGMGQGINIPAIQTLLTRLAPLEYRAAFMSMNGMVLRLGQTLGPVVLGLVVLVGPLSGAFYFGALLACTLFIFLLIWDRE